MTDHANELRIIARDGGRLTDVDRAMIADSANELEQALHAAEKAQTGLIEEAGRRVALAEALREANRKLLKAGLSPDGLPWSMSSGWIKWQVT